MTQTPRPNQDGRVPVIFRATGGTTRPDVRAIFPNEPGPKGEHQALYATLGPKGLTWGYVGLLDYMKRSVPYAGPYLVMLKNTLGVELDIRQRITPENHEVRRHRALAHAREAGPELGGAAST